MVEQGGDVNPQTGWAEFKSTILYATIGPFTHSSIRPMIDPKKAKLVVDRFEKNLKQLRRKHLAEIRTLLEKHDQEKTARLKSAMQKMT